jgi:1-acyl-sn-glycerol-3-phosphate acyltransferase
MMAALLAGVARFLSGASIRWMDVAPDLRQRIYFANHTSHLDAVVLWSALPPTIRALTRPVAARSYWIRTRLRRYLSERVFHAILIEREGITRDTNPLPLILREMGERYSLILFPEGKRNPGPEVGEFKSGLFHLCRARPDLELVPAYIDNLNRVLPKGEFLPVPLLSGISFGPPLRLVDGEPKAEFLARAREAVCRLKGS